MFWMTLLVVILMASSVHHHAETAPACFARAVHCSVRGVPVLGVEPVAVDSLVDGWTGRAGWKHADRNYPRFCQRHAAQAAGLEPGRCEELAPAESAEPAAESVAAGPGVALEVEVEAAPEAAAEVEVGAAPEAGAEAEVEPGALAQERLRGHGSDPAADWWCQYCD